MTDRTIASPRPWFRFSPEVAAVQDSILRSFLADLGAMLKRSGPAWWR